jgi:hypothetical protein
MIASRITIIAVACAIGAIAAPPPTPPVGFQGAIWGMSSAEAKTAINPAQWQQATGDKSFPDSLRATIFTSQAEIAGYPAIVRYYFVDDKFFQATARFPFKKLENYDFNYNVFRSVDQYYQAIRSQTLTFVFDIYDLLSKKYGTREPYFDKLDPRQVFVEPDKYLRKERWNLRYHPYDYYKKIIASAYARWDYPKTRILFSVNISASDKRFDYLLSLTSLDLEHYINKRKDQLRSKGL